MIILFYPFKLYTYAQVFYRSDSQPVGHDPLKGHQLITQGRKHKDNIRDKQNKYIFENIVVR